MNVVTCCDTVDSDDLQRVVDDLEGAAEVAGMDKSVEIDGVKKSGVA